MKISPIASGGTPGSDISPPTAPKLASGSVVHQNMPTIKMRTNASTNRHDSPQIQEEEVKEEPVQETSTKTDEIGQTQAAVESTQPLSPQLADLAKQRRALQVKERELKEREAKLTQSPVNSEDYVNKADLLSNPLKIFDLGLTYDKLTEAILANQSGITPEIREMKEELRRVKEDVNKTLSERDSQAEKQVLAEMEREAKSLIQSGDDYEMVRETGHLPEVIDLIYRTYKKTGEVLAVTEALSLVETDLIEQAIKQANIGKIKKKITPEPVHQPQSEGKQMKTLTNRDGASIQLDRRARAIAAMRGTLRR